MKKTPGLLILGVLGFGILTAPALASGGSGGSGSGGSGGGGGNTITTTPVTMTNWGLFNGTLPVGQATFSYSQDGTYKSLSIQASGINIPDGDDVDVEVDEAWRVSNWIAHNYSYYTMTIQQESGSLSWSTANGDSVPFLLPTLGETTITIWGTFTPTSGTRILQTSFGALTRG